LRSGGNGRKYDHCYNFRTTPCRRLRSGAGKESVVDGNKRAAFLAAGLFLALNGYRLGAAQADATLTMLALAAGETDEAEFARWIRANSAPR
jgi:death-on-curing protein